MIPDRPPGRALVTGAALWALTMLTASCSWFNTMQDNLEVLEAVQAGYAEAERTQAGVYFVVKENTWFCPGPENAPPVLGTLEDPCEGGHLLEVNELVDTVGADPVGRAWRVMYLDDERPSGDGWVKRDALATSPLLERYRASRDAFQEEFATERRMTVTVRTPEAFLAADSPLRELVWLDSVRRDFVYDLTYATDGLSFWLPIAGAGRKGLEAFFYLRSDRYVQRMRRHRYGCTEAYCDEFSFVAVLTEHRYQPEDRVGPEGGFPVMKIIRFADRLDEYRVEDPPREASPSAGATRVP